MSETIFILERQDKVSKDLWLDLDSASLTFEGCRMLERQSNMRKGHVWAERNPGFRVVEGTWTEKAAGEAMGRSEILRLEALVQELREELAVVRAQEVQ